MIIIKKNHESDEVPEILKTMTVMFQIHDLKVFAYW